MDRIKKIVSDVLKPSILIILFTDLAAVPLLIVALNYFSETHPVSLAAYLLSAYALTVTIVNFGRIHLRSKELLTGDELAFVRWIKKTMRRHKYTRLYLESKDFRAEIALYAGLAVNIVFACLNGAAGITSRSPWAVSIGVYYLFLGLIRFVMMLGVHKRNRYELEYRQRKLYEYTKYRLCGIMLIILNLAMSGMAVQMIWQNKANEYSQTMVIASAAYTFYCFIAAIVNVVSFRRRDNAILSAAKLLSMTAALMSMYSLQTSMLHTFSNGDDENYRRTMNIITGGVVTAGVLLISVFMVVKGTKKIREYSGT